MTEGFQGLALGGGARGAEPPWPPEAIRGLWEHPKWLPAKLFYDFEGVRLFGLITALPEYYLTRTERALLLRIAGDLAAQATAPATLVEYGASDEGKARLLLDAAPGCFAHYVPIDVAAGALAAMRTRLAATHPGLAVHPLAADFTAPIALPAGLPHPIGFFPGSTIGNLEPPAAQAFLARARETLGAGARLIVGHDICQDVAALLPAYDDAAGVTASFNLNLLRRLNRECGADFDLGTFVHRVRWNAAASCIEMHLESLVAQTVTVAGRPVVFAAGETIHTENSIKYGVAAFAALAAAAGWAVQLVWVEGARFAVQVLG